MSQRALLLAVRAHLWANMQVDSLALDSKRCDLAPMGKPYPMAGQIFIGIWEGYLTNQDHIGQYRDDSYGINITVTRRLPEAPADRWQTEIVAKAMDGLLVLCEMVAALIHMDPENSTTNAVRARANTIIGPSANGFITPLMFRNSSPSEIKDGAWFYAAREKYAGVAKTLVFDGAERPQTIESQE